MQTLDELFSAGTSVSCASNVPVLPKDVAGWLRLTGGKAALFLTTRAGGECGKRHFCAMLEPGDGFRGGAFFPAEKAGQEAGWILVPQGPCEGTIVSDDAFAAWEHDHPAEAALFIQRFIRAASAFAESEAEPAADSLTLPEVLREIVRHSLEGIRRHEQEALSDSAAEREWQADRRHEQFAALRDIAGERARAAQGDLRDPLDAALHEIAAHYDFPIRTSFGETQGKSVGARIRAFCQINQWRVRPVRLESGYSLGHHEPILGFRRDTGAPCIIELRGEESVWRTPGDPEEHPLRPETEKVLLTGAFCFYESLPKRRVDRHDLLKFLFRGSRTVLLWVGAAGLLVGLFGLITPLATEYVTGKIIPTANTSELWQLLVLMLSLSVGTAVLNLVPQLCMVLLGSGVLERFLAALFDRIFRLPLAFFHRHDAGDLCMRLLAAIELQEVAFQVLTQQFIGSLFSLCSAIMLFHYSWKLTLVAIPMVLLYALLLLFVFSRLRTPLRVAADQNGREAGFLKQAFDGIAKIRGSGAEERMETRFLDEFIVERQAHEKCIIGSAWMGVLGVVMPAVINLVFFWLIGNRWRGSMETAGFLAFLTAFGSFQTGIVSLAQGIWQLASVKPEVDRLEVFMDSEVETPEGKQQAGRLDGSVELSHVAFAYGPGQPPVLRDVSLTVRPGEFVAIVGPSGAGKSSLVRLLLGFETPDKGSILYGGQDLRELDVASVRRQLGVILQNSRVMPGTILENITAGAGSTASEAMAAARLAALDKDIEAMPMGLHTMIGDGLLSGGQSQRVLIARALIGKPAIVIMDESTSALDNETQDAVARNIERLSVTRIIIAHRLSTIINADRIHVLNNGVIEESGTFEELMARDGLFRTLARRQML